MPKVQVARDQSSQLSVLEVLVALLQRLYIASDERSHKEEESEQMCRLQGMQDQKFLKATPKREKNAQRCICGLSLRQRDLAPANEVACAQL